jgi:hypothetical protein
MIMKTKSTILTNQNSASNDNINFTLNDAGKLASMFYRFARGERHHRFSAEVVGDHCLPTTISDLQKKHTIYFERKFIRVPNRFGSMTPVKLYWLEGDSLIRARLLAGLIEVAA